MAAAHRPAVPSPPRRRQTPKLIVETDGRAAHTTRRACERDRIRDAGLTLAGYRVVRITDARLKGEPGTVAAQLGKLLAA